MHSERPASSGASRRSGSAKRHDELESGLDRRGSRQLRRERKQRRQRRRRFAVSSLLILGLVGSGAYALDTLASADGAGPGPTAPPSPESLVTPTVTTPPVPTEPPAVLTLPGLFPADGPGRFEFGTEQGDPLGESGQLLRFRVGVEEDIEEDLSEFAEFVDETLGDEQGWTAGGDLQFQRVPEGAPHDFTIYLATSGTTTQICAQGGLEVATPSLPEGGVSCRLPGQVVLNLHRWRLSVDHFVAGEVPLSTYRQMVLNHEVGHELGLGHEACPEPGGPAPVMQQQSLFLEECEANPWPYLDGRRHTGPPTV